jgi:hypothetical protein
VSGDKERSKSFCLNKDFVDADLATGAGYNPFECTYLANQAPEGFSHIKMTRTQQERVIADQRKEIDRLKTIIEKMRSLAGSVEQEGASSL